MNFVGAVLLCGCMCIYSGVSGSITCRRCVDAILLGDCIGNVTCGESESCYMDQAITVQYTIEYTAGCRAKDVCSVGHYSPIGKRSIVKRADLVSCSRCCDTEAPGGCNAKLCGIRPGSRLTCQRCDHAASMANCTFTSCSNTESCYMDEIITDQFEIKYNAGCRAKQVCPGAVSVAVGKRVNEHIACSRCCDTEAPGGCNAKFCGIKPIVLTCRRCDHAASLANCTTVICSPTENCYMDRGITVQHAVFFTAGCRAKDVCSVGLHTPIGKRSIGKRAEQIVCSICCDTPDRHGCNSRLCGIDDLHGLNSRTQCYFCDHTAHSGQGNLRNPVHCVNMTTCQSDEVCSVQQSVLGTEIKWTYGCLNKRMCQLQTPPMLHDMLRCYIHKNKDACGFSRRSQNLCTVCCGDDGCNQGTCEDIKIQLFNLYVNGMFNLTTLKTNGATPLSTVIPPQHHTTRAGP